MSVSTLPAANDAPPLFIQPTAADAAPRTGPPAPPVKPPKPVTVDPEAPYGWMTDPITKEVRPRRSAGRQSKGGTAKKVAAPPAKRAANQPRIAPPAPGSDSPIEPANHAEQVSQIIDGLWMMVAGIPKNEMKGFGIDFGALTVRAKAQAAVLADQKPSLSQGIGMIADHVPMVASGVEWLTKDGGPGWIIPAAMVLIPFAAASAAIWRAPLAEIEALAERTDNQWAALVHHQQQQLAQAAAEESAAQAQHAQYVAAYPGEVPLPGLESS